MNEIIPPSEPGPPKINLPSRDNSIPPSSPSFALMFGLGILLLVVSTLLCIVIGPISFLLGAIGAFISLFFKGYRGIFVGYISTIGVVLLGMIAYCSIYPIRFD